MIDGQSVIKCNTIKINKKRFQRRNLPKAAMKHDCELLFVYEGGAKPFAKSVITRINDLSFSVRI